MVSKSWSAYSAAIMDEILPDAGSEARRDAAELRELAEQLEDQANAPTGWAAAGRVAVARVLARRDVESDESLEGPIDVRQLVADALDLAFGGRRR